MPDHQLLMEGERRERVEGEREIRQTKRRKGPDQMHQEAGDASHPLHSYIWQKFNVQSGRAEDEQWWKIAIMLRHNLR